MLLRENLMDEVKEVESWDMVQVTPKSRIYLTQTPPPRRVIMMIQPEGFRKGIFFSRREQYLNLKKLIEDFDDEIMESFDLMEEDK